MSELSLTVSRTIKAPPKALFDAWLDPSMLARFMLAAPGMTIPKASADARVGGRFDLIMAHEGREMPHGGEYLEIEPHSRIVFTWESPFSTPGSTVTLTFRPVKDATEVTLNHVKFPTEESRDNHAKGWGAILATLDSTFAEAAS